MSSYYAPTLNKLIEQFASLPSIGMKTARRLAFYIISLPEERAKLFADSILRAKQTIKCCDVCQNLTDTDVCNICGNAKRDSSIICVVEGPKDVVAMETTGEFNGVYHVLHGAISPMDGIKAEDIRIKELMSRLDDSVKEVIMATNPTIQGEATAMYISKMIKPLGVRVSRISYGIAVNSDLEYADRWALGKALESRREI